MIFTPIQTSGLEELDVMVSLIKLRPFITLIQFYWQYAYQSDIGMYKDTPVPNPDLVALDVKFGPIDELILTEIVPRFS